MAHGMRKTIVLILFIVAALPVMAQRRADYGLSLGVTNYLGEKNPDNFFNGPGPAVQFFYRYNLNPRQALRANLLGGSLRDLNVADEFINAAVGELGVTYEYNFFPYSTMRSRHVDYTPYIAAGAAFSMVYNQTAPQSFVPFLSIPFSAGFKINVANNLGLELEYGFRKTFNDKFDGLEDQTDPNTGERYSRIHNSDWYSFFGVSVTWKWYNKLAGCPAFAEMGKDKKRKK
jgi:hypothetical protein